GLSSLDQPLVMRIGTTYITPRVGPRAVSTALRDWAFNVFLYYGSGTPLAAPTANPGPNAISSLTFQTGNRQLRSGQPLYLPGVDPNCACLDPNTTFVLNPLAWTNPAAGQYGGATYYSDFRGERRPVENFGIGRQFQIKERVKLNVRAEFTNMFNRTYWNNPSLSSPQTAPVCKQANGLNG